MTIEQQRALALADAKIKMAAADAKPVSSWETFKDIPLAGQYPSINQIKGAGPMVADMGLEAGLTTAGQALGALGGPVASVTVPAGGYVGGVTGNALAQLRRNITGEQKGFRLGENQAAGVAGLVPGAALMSAGAKAIVKEGIKQGLTNVAATAIQTGIDNKRLPTTSEVTAATVMSMGGTALAKKLGTDKFFKETQREINNAARDAAVEVGHKLGYVFPPSKVNPNSLNKLLESLAGPPDTIAQSYILNQEISNSLARKGMGLPPDAPLTFAILEKAKQDIGPVYQAVADLGSVAEKTLADLRTQRYRRQYNQEAMRNPNIAPSAREAAEKAAELATFNETLLNDTLENIVSKSGKPELYRNFVEGRKRYAIISEVEGTMKITGEGGVAANTLANIQNQSKGKRLTGELADIAQVAGQFPSETRFARDSKVPGVTGSSFWRSGIGSLAGGTIGYKLGGGGGAVAGMVLGRTAGDSAASLARGAMLSGPGQRFLAAPQYRVGSQENLSAALARLSAQEAGRPNAKPMFTIPNVPPR